MNQNLKEKNREKTIEVEFPDKEEKKPDHLSKKSEETRKKEKKAAVKNGKKDWEKEYKELYDKYVRLHAEFENFKRRMTKDKQDAIKFANQELIRQILPFVDNLERSLQHADEAKNIDALKEGIEMTLKDFLKTLERSGRLYSRILF